MQLQKFQGENPNVTKYVFTTADMVAEAVLYRYENKRTVICCSVQSGCPVGCIFCGTGKKFIRNLTAFEITEQIRLVLGDANLGDTNSATERFQIMFMSMGEPMLNWPNVDTALFQLHRKYPNAELLLSTIGVNDRVTFRDICETSRYIPKLGLQFSLHSGWEEERNHLIPFGNKMTIRDIRDAGIAWNKVTNRPVFLNYCVTTDGTSNLDSAEVGRLMDIFSPEVFYFTFSAVCLPTEGKFKSSYSRSLEEKRLSRAMETFLSQGYNVRTFNPAGQDDIGGGCGQLWFVQEWFKKHDK